MKREQPPPGPVVIHVSSDGMASTPDIQTLIEETRRRADAFVFLHGGASNMSDAAKGRLIDLFGALTLLADRGVRIAVGDGGTQTGIMEAAGLARKASRHLFPLIGMSPAPEITVSGEAGRTAVDPNHTHVVAVDNPPWIEAKRQQGWTPGEGYWGCETAAMSVLWNRLAEGRPSVAIVANGGAITLDEVTADVAANRRIVLVAGSGRAADALVSSLRGSRPPDEDSGKLRAQVDSMRLAVRADLFRVFDLNQGPESLARLLEQMLAAG